MSDRNTLIPAFTSLISADVLSRAFVVAIVLGSILTLVNQPEAIFGNATTQVLPLILVYLTPFIVVTLSQALGSYRAIWEAQSGIAQQGQNEGFITTAMSHGIPMRALLLAICIGVINTLVIVLDLLVSSGTLLQLPTTAIGQAFVLPLMFGLISQAISYRRAVAASDHNPAPIPSLIKVTKIAPLWKRLYNFIKEMEEASQYTPAERAIVGLSHKVSNLEDTIRNLENKTH